MCECSPESIVPKERSITSVEPVYLCNECGKRLQRHYGGFGIQFKGNGFYKTDNPK
jgi:predicted nucleic acid-binding Zn ribbon protein